MQKSGEQSITRRLTRMNLLVSGTALFLACAAFSMYDWETYRANTIRARAGQALMISLNSAMPLELNDPRPAEKTLAALQSTRSLWFAGIYKADGTPFAIYWRDRARGSLSCIRFMADNLLSCVRSFLMARMSAPSI
jgi:hypothetical protein